MVVMPYTPDLAIMADTVIQGPEVFFLRYLCRLSTDQHTDRSITATLHIITDPFMRTRITTGTIAAGGKTYKINMRKAQSKDWVFFLFAGDPDLIILQDWQADPDFQVFLF